MNSSKKEDCLVTVVLKIEMHCEGCALKTRRSVKGFKGVEAAVSDISGSRLTVIGKFDPLELRGFVERKTRRKVDLVSPVVAVETEESSEDEGDEDANAQMPVKTNDKKRAAAAATAAAAASAAMEAGEMDYHGGGYCNYPYRIRMEAYHAQQLFSDENPNACSIM